MIGMRVAVALAVSLAVLCSHADDSALPDADEIVAKVNARDDGAFVKRKVKMTLRDKGGAERVRETMSWRKWFDGDKKTIVFFLSPANVRDTGFLTFDYAEAGKDDDQWLYLPAARKVRRISATDRGDYFVGTDFTYEDIKKETKISAEDFTFRTLGIEEIDGHRCYKVDATATEAAAKELGYARGVSWFDAEILIARKTEYYDAAGKLLRTVLTQDVQQIDGVWTAMRITATMHKTGHVTEFRFSEVDYTTPIDDAMFTEQALMRGARGN
jgi:outer membrane lipoprotein-sorting protein